MADYTTQLRTICESVAGLTESAGGNETDNVIATARPIIFSFTYPVIQNVTPKEELETKILKHYYFREIGFETYGQWKHFLSARMNEIMPYYNQLYKSAVDMAEIDPFTDTNYTRSIERRGDDTVKSSGTDSTLGHSVASNEDTLTREYDDYEVKRTPNLNNTSLFSDTPQGSISNITMENGGYLTNATIDKETGTDTTETNGKIIDTTEYGKTMDTSSSITHGKQEKTTFNSDIDETIVGKMGSTQYADMLKKLRETFLNIDMMIIKDLSDLFMNIY